VLVIIFLVFGFVCMTVGAIFSLVMAVQYDGDADLRPMGPVYYYIIFFVSSVSALVYYSMWSETGVMHVHDGEHIRIVFPARYLDWCVCVCKECQQVCFGADVPLCLFVSECMCVRCR